jgi:tetratricopeptide (TPR) repeat protein
VLDFATGPNGGNVIAVRGAGEFDAELPADLQRRFPNIEIVDLRGAGIFWFLNPPRANRLANEKLKLLGPLLDIPAGEMPRLRQEEERRQQTRIGAILGVSVAVLVAVTGLSVFALQSRNQAVRALEDSMYAAGSMALQAASLDRDDEATAQVRRLLVNRGCDLVDKFRAVGVGEPQIQELVMCRIERAQTHEQLKEFDRARQQYTDAIDLAATRYRKLPRMDAGLAMIKARESYARYFLDQQDKAGAEAQYGVLLEEARTLAAVHEGRRDFLRAEAEALGQIGDLVAERGDPARAAVNYETAAQRIEDMLGQNTASDRPPDAQTVAWLARLHRLAADQTQKRGNASAAIEGYHRATVATTRARNPVPPIVEQETAFAQASLFSLERQNGNPTAAERAKALALRSIDLIVKSSAAPDRLKQRADGIKRWIEAQDAKK